MTTYTAAVMLFILLAPLPLLTTTAPTEIPNMEVTGQKHLPNPSTPYVRNTKPGQIDPLLFSPLEQVRLSLSSFQVVSTIHFLEDEITLTELTLFTRRLIEDTLQMTQIKVLNQEKASLHRKISLSPQLRSLKDKSTTILTLIQATIEDYLTTLDLKPSPVDTNQAEPSRITWNMVNSMRCTQLWLTIMFGQERHLSPGQAHYCSCMAYFKIKELDDECNRATPTLYEQRIKDQDQPSSSSDLQGASLIDTTPQQYIKWYQDKAARRKNQLKAEAHGILNKLHYAENYPTQERLQEFLNAATPICENKDKLAERAFLSQIYNQVCVKVNQEQNKGPSTSPRAKRIALVHPITNSTHFFSTTHIGIEQAWEQAQQLWQQFDSNNDPAILHQLIQTSDPICTMAYMDSSNKFFSSISRDSLIAWCEEIQILRLSIPSKPSRKKRFIDTLIVGALSFMGYRHNKRTINQLKDNVRILSQNTQQNREDLLELANYVNLTSIEMAQHRELLHKLEETSLQNTFKIGNLGSQMEALDMLNALVAEFSQKIETVKTTLEVVQLRIKKMGRILTSFSQGAITPEMVSPSHARSILEHVQHKLDSHPRLALFGDALQDIWTFYKHVKMIPIPFQDHLIVTMQIPLVDKDTLLDLYKITNLDVLNPDLGLKFTYQVDQQYIAFSHNRSYYMTPSSVEVASCHLSAGAWCRFSSPMSSTIHAPNCPSAVFLKKEELILEHCEVKPTIQKRPSAIHWKDQTWIISLLKPTAAYIHCLTTEQRKPLLPPHATLQIPPSCSAFIGDYLYIPPSTTLHMELSADSLIPPMDLATLVYTPIDSLRLFDGLQMQNYSQEELDKMTTKLLHYDSIPLPEFKKSLKDLNYNYPKEPSLLSLIDKAWSNSSSIVKYSLILGSVGLVLAGIIFILYKTKGYRFLMGLITFRMNERKAITKPPTPPPTPEDPAKTSSKVRFAEDTKVKDKPKKVKGSLTDLEDMAMELQELGEEEPPLPPPPPPLRISSRTLSRAFRRSFRLSRHLMPQVIRRCQENQESYVPQPQPAPNVYFFDKPEVQPAEGEPLMMTSPLPTASIAREEIMEPPAVDQSNQPKPTPSIQPRSNLRKQMKELAKLSLDSAEALKTSPSTSQHSANIQQMTSLIQQLSQDHKEEQPPGESSL